MVGVQEVGCHICWPRIDHGYLCWFSLTGTLYNAVGWHVVRERTKERIVASKTS